MKTSLTIFVKAIGLYMLLTVPAIFLPPLYIMSVLYMLMYSGIAGILFATAFFFLQRTQMSFRGKMIALYVSVVPSVAIAFQMMEVCGTWPGVWQSGYFMSFPLFAVFAGWISIYQCRKTIEAGFATAGAAILLSPINQ